MKKNIIKATLVAVVTLVAGYNVYSSQKLEGMSDLALANVEALAWPDEFPEYEVNCPHSSSNYGNCRTLYIDYNVYPRRASCVKSSNPNSSCTYSTETEANRYL